MSDINQVTLVGRLGQEPILRKTKSDQSVVQLSLATSHGFGEKETTTWHKITVWGAQAEACKRYLGKGSQVLVQGRIRHSKYETSDGQVRDSTEINADQVVFLGKPRIAREESSLPAEVTA